MKWSIGDIQVTLAREGIIPMPIEMVFPDADPAVVKENADWLDSWLEPEGQVGFSTHSLIVESGDQTIVVDTGIGTHDLPGMPQMSNMPSDLVPQIEAAGFARDDVTQVVCTHLHYDHVGGNTTQVDGGWVRTFPQARYLFTEPDLRHWEAHKLEGSLSFDTAVQPLLDAGVVDAVPVDHQVAPGVTLLSTPGHSPGHVSVLVSSQGQEAVITGDVLHHPVQFAAPDWAMFLDADPELARQTRHEFIDRFADSGVRIFGTHFIGSSSGYLTRENGRTRFQ